MDKKFRGTFVPGSYDVGLKNVLDGNLFGERKPDLSYDRKMRYQDQGKQSSSTFPFSRMAKDNIMSPKSSQKHRMENKRTTTISR